VKKEPVPHCPHCRTAKYVMLDKTATRVGTAIGGLAGAGVGLSGIFAEETPAKAVLRVLAQATSGIPLKDIPKAILVLLSAMLAGAITGSALGELIDCNLRLQYRCHNCGIKITM
jgi:hypothetical protein